MKKTKTILLTLCMLFGTLLFAGNFNSTDPQPSPESYGVTYSIQNAENYSVEVYSAQRLLNTLVAPNDMLSEARTAPANKKIPR